MSRRATVTQGVILMESAPAEAGTMPGALMPCGDRPFLAWLMRELQRYGVENFVVLADASARLAQALETLPRHLPKPARIVLSSGADPAGSVGAWRQARAHLEERFLVCRGGSLFDGNLAALLARAAAEPGVPGWRGLCRPEDPERDGTGPLDAGIALVRRDLLDQLLSDSPPERAALPELAASGRLRDVVMTGRLHTTGQPSGSALARREIPERLRRPALLLDRDGVINHDHGWVGTRERFDWTPDGRAAIRLATAAGWHVFVVTNQSGVARGHYDEAQMNALHDWMIDEVRSQGGTIDDLRACPFHEEASVPRYRRRSDWRKPAPGMLLDLVRAWELDPARCVMIGDQPTDMMAAEAAGIAGHLTRGGDLLALLAGLGLTS